MQAFHTDDIRTIALVGHGAAGKTTLVDALLHKAHAVDRFGSVDDETSVSDFDEEEHRRHFSIDTSVLHAEHRGKQLHLLDAPGYPDFVGAALEALQAVETAVIVISATNGIEVNTRRMYQEATRRNLARMIVLNKLDAEKVRFSELIAAIQATFGKHCVLIDAPDAIGPQFRAVFSLLNPPATVPATCPLDVPAARTQLIEAIVEADEGLLEKYLLEGTLSADELEAALPKAIAAGTIVPIFCTDAKHELGIDELLDGLSQYALSPKLTTHLQGVFRDDHGTPVPVEAKEEAEFLGQVFKSVFDKYVGHLSFIRVLAGKLTTDHPLVNLRTKQTCRVGHLLLVQGKQHTKVAEAYPGDIVAVAKVEGLHIGDTVAFNPNAPRLPEPHFPTPMFGLAVEPKNRGDEQKISQTLHKIAEEDPTIRVSHDPQTHEMVISGVSPLHLDVIQQRMKRRFDVEIITKEPKIAYRETITVQAAADHRHKKQSGGRGQFGEVHLRVYPLSRAIKSLEQLQAEFANKSNFEKMRAVHYDPEHNFAFIDHIVGGTIPNQFLPACEKGCKELLEHGALAGYRVQDIAVEVYFGKDHPVDSSEAAFKTAARLALKKAILAARPVLLEPIVHLEVTVPSRYTGVILSDLNTKRAHVENQESLPGELTVLSARAPLAELTRYAAQLGSITQGQGSYTMEYSHYEVTPAVVQQAIIAKAKIVADEEE